MNDEMEARLSALIDGALTPVEEVELRGELERSPELRQRLAELEAVDQTLRELPVPAATDALRERLRARLAAEPAAGAAAAPRSASRPPPRRRGRLRWTAVAALVAAAAALVLFLRPTPLVDGASDTPGALARRAGGAPADPDAIATRTDEVELAMADFLASESPAPGGSVADPEAEAAPFTLAADADDDLEVIEVLDLLAALDLEASSG